MDADISAGTCVTGNAALQNRNVSARKSRPIVASKTSLTSNNPRRRSSRNPSNPKHVRGVAPNRLPASHYFWQAGLAQTFHHMRVILRPNPRDATPNKHVKDFGRNRDGLLQRSLCPINLTQLTQ